MKTSRSFNFSKPNLKNLEPDIKNYIQYLKAENAKLQKYILRLEMSDLSKTNKIKAMKKKIIKLVDNQRVGIFLPYGGHGELPTHIQTLDGKFIKIYYKHKKTSSQQVIAADG